VGKFLTDGKLGLPAKDNIPSMVTSSVCGCPLRDVRARAVACEEHRAVSPNISGEPASRSAFRV